MPELDVIDVGDFANDPDADDLQAGGVKANSNFGRLFQQNVAFSTGLDFTGHKRYAASTLVGETVFSIQPDYIRGGSVTLELTGGSIRLPSAIRVASGFYDASRTNLIEIVNEGGVSGVDAELVARITTRDSAPSTGLVLRNNPTNSRSDLFGSFSEALSSNPTSPTPFSEAKFSRMSQLESFRAWDGYFYFRLKYFNSSSVQQGTDIVWRQRSNPADETAALNRVDDYTSIAGTNQLAFARASDSSIATPGGMCLQAFNAATTWTMFPGEFDTNVTINGTIGATNYSPGQFNPGINITDVIVELSCEAAL